MHNWCKCITWPNIPQLNWRISQNISQFSKQYVLRKIFEGLKKHNSLQFNLKICNRLCPQTNLISKYIFRPNGGYCLYFSMVSKMCCKNPTITKFFNLPFSTFPSSILLCNGSYVYYLTQFSGSFSQSMLQRNLSQAIHPTKRKPCRVCWLNDKKLE